MNQYESTQRVSLLQVETPTIAAGASYTHTFTPQVQCASGRFVVDENIGANFTISSIRIGKEEQFWGSGGISALLFSPRAVDALNLQFDLINAGTQVSITVTNIAASGTSVFRGAFHGTEIA